MKLSFHGAARQVTGSCFLLETKQFRILIDCGLFQGSNFNEGRNHDAFPFDPKSIDAIFVTHAHIDHNGRIPKLVREGFKGKIYSTKGTRELMQVVWNDAVKIMKYNKKKFGMPVLYRAEDVTLASSRCKGVDYENIVKMGKDLSATFHDAGHIFGSSILEVETEGKRLVFSGDLGNENVPILQDTKPIGKSVDVLLIESTYGNRLHETTTQRKKIVQENIERAIERGGTVMIPSFSIERTQELIYELHDLIDRKKALPKIPIFLDSPMAIAALPVYKRHPEYYDTEAEQLRKAGDDFFKFPGLKLTRTKEESKAINHMRGTKIIIAGSGMMTGGRILHHALRYLDDPHSTLLIIGYCAKGTLGRRLYEGADEVTIMNHKVEVRATVKAIGALSAHGDQKKLLKWAKTATGAPKRIFVVHGETQPATELAHRLQDQFGGRSEVNVPDEGDVIEV